ncbi:MAG: site-specific DNA-methyltransferase, partial [Thermodesulfobacteriota bacterium]
SDDGSLWITIDDNEAHYLKVLCDEVFGRKNFVVNVVWQKRTSPDNRLRLGDAHDSILVFRKNKSFGNETFNQLPVSDGRSKDFKNPDNDLRGPWASTDFTGMTGHATPNQFYTITSPSGTDHPPPAGRCWALAEETFRKLLADNRVWFGKDGKARPRLKRFLSEMEGQNSWSWWPNTEVGHNQEAKKEIVTIFGANSTFDTPKPERLLKRILEIATSPGDLVLDSFGGSGTTGAVSHKMGRRWIMVELGEHCHTHIIPRMKKVIDGTDQGGISKAVNWKGGGGFRYYRLAPSLLEKDKWDNWVISKEYNAAMLAAAMAKHEGFVYNPDETLYWKQGRSTEKDYIFTTTNFITVEYLDGIHEEMAPGESLLLCCKSYQEACADRYSNITVKKIPNMLLGRCEFGRDDYSLNIADMPVDPDSREVVTVGSEPVKRSSRRKVSKNQSILFDEGGEAANTDDRDEDPEKRP